jgi:cyclopropane-fatty-acyl-phospholipid synthase
MDRILRAVFSRIVRRGSLELTSTGGKRFTVGDGTGVPLAIRFTRRASELRVVFDPQLRFGEAFMDGGFVVEQGSIYDVLLLLMGNLKGATAPGFAAALDWVRYGERRFRQFNPIDRAHRNVEHHYDLDARLYGLFLDADRQYSCAYFETVDSSLEEAQLAKKRHLAAKLCVEPGMRVLDIGSGWGGLGLYLGAAAGADVTGITLSQEQLGIARARAGEQGLDSRVRFELRDYRTMDGCFDRIISVGMFEHVGIDHYKEFFDTCSRLLDENGVMMLHSIGRFDPPGHTNPWIDKYIFPGGYVPALSEVFAHIERSGLLVTDVEILRLHYAETLRAWRERFLARRDEALALYDERFCRMWEFYLAASEASFRIGDMMVFQLQLTKKQDAVPLTRDYVAGREADLREREAVAPPLRLAGE